MAVVIVREALAVRTLQPARRTGLRDRDPLLLSPSAGWPNRLCQQALAIDPRQSLPRLRRLWGAGLDRAGVNSTGCRARLGVFPGSRSPTRSGDI